MIYQIELTDDEVDALAEYGLQCLMNPRFAGEQAAGTKGEACKLAEQVIARMSEDVLRQYRTPPDARG